MMHSKSDNIKIMINDEADDVIGKLLSRFLTNIKSDWKHQWKVVVLPLIVFICLYYKCHSTNFKWGE